MSPIRGTRFKCLVRENFDLCAACEAAKVETYPSIKLLVQPAPAAPAAPAAPVPASTQGERAYHPALHGHGHNHGRGWRERFRNHVAREHPWRPFMEAAANIAESLSAATAAGDAASAGTDAAAGAGSACNPSPCNAAAYDLAADEEIVADVLRESMKDAGRDSNACVGAGTNASACNCPARLCCRFVRHLTHADGTEVTAGEQFFKTWRVRNDGAHAWPEGSALQFQSGDFLDHVCSDLPLAKAGEEVDISVALIAPEAEGRYTTYFRISAPDGKLFGQRVWCDVHVVPKQAPKEATV